MSKIYIPISTYDLIIAIKNHHNKQLNDSINMDLYWGLPTANRTNFENYELYIGASNNNRSDNADFLLIPIIRLQDHSYRVDLRFLLAIDKEHQKSLKAIIEKILTTSGVQVSASSQAEYLKIDTSQVNANIAQQNAGNYGDLKIISSPYRDTRIEPNPYGNHINDHNWLPEGHPRKDWDVLKDSKNQDNKEYSDHERTKPYKGWKMRSHADAPPPYSVAPKDAHKAPPPYPVAPKDVHKAQNMGDDQLVSPLYQTLGGPIGLQYQPAPKAEVAEGPYGALGNEEPEGPHGNFGDQKKEVAEGPSLVKENYYLFELPKLYSTNTFSGKKDIDVIYATKNYAKLAQKDGKWVKLDILFDDDYSTSIHLAIPIDLIEPGSEVAKLVSEYEKLGNIRMIFVNDGQKQEKDLYQSNDEKYGEDQGDEGDEGEENRYSDHEYSEGPVELSGGAYGHHGDYHGE